MIGKASFFLVALFLVSFFITLACSEDPTRNKILFQDSLLVVQDSLKMMDHLMTKLPKRDVNNAFVTNEDSLVINNRKIGRVTTGDKVDFVPIVMEETGFNQGESMRFVSLILYLRDNCIGGCFRHIVFGMHFYMYRITPENNSRDLRYIILNDENLKNVRGSYAESYQILDRKSDLILIAPADIKIK